MVKSSGLLTSKRHVSTVPVKLIRVQNAGHHPHSDSRFAAATIEYLKDLAILLGSKSTFVISQDDKTRVPLDLSAAKKTSTIINAFRNNLDALFVAINAPGHSAYNQVEHCMAPLSHD
ncbi:unnamed protein product [Adineta steineri]|uniref:Uncharacterized protein n=1 Tax=Adineta steineri TaxID=433720 RepID=A0A819RDK6_9BILA|nr:unnamed protein product [Adineta steineri]